jgi:hypothetical protein
VQLTATDTGVEHFDRIEDIARLIAGRRQPSAVA